MLVKVLKDFAYAPDCRTTLQLKKGQIADIDESVLDGLAAEKFIGEAAPEEIEAAAEGAVVIASPVEIPDNWRGLDWFKLQALARKLGAGPKINKAGAVALVEAELAARAG